jgi:hypothetical protein
VSIGVDQNDWIFAPDDPDVEGADLQVFRQHARVIF